MFTSPFKLLAALWLISAVLLVFDTIPAEDNFRLRGLIVIGLSFLAGAAFASSDKNKDA